MALLDSTCADDPSLRSELLALIAAADEAPRFLSALATEVVAPAVDVAAAEAIPEDLPPSTADAPTRAMTGSRVRHYEVLAPLGAGGMGIVHRGRDTKLGRDVALKFLSAERFADLSARQRLLREARAVSSLDDPHVCALHAIEETDDGGICLVMGLCAGGTLRDRLRLGPLSAQSAVSIATQLASGLASAHRRQIIHRDLKPANVGFTDMDVAKILDFGVAVRLGAEDTVSAFGTSSFAGTLPYTAPELLRGQAPNAQTDLWALGVVMYEMLCGRRPFLAATDAALLFTILEGEPPPLERTDGEHIPEAVGTLVRDLLAKNPAARPTDAEAVLARLRTLDGPWPTGPAAVATETPRRREGGFSRRTTAGLLVGIGVAAIALLYMRKPASADSGNSGRAASVSQPLPTLAVLPFAVRGGTDLEYLREGMVDLLTPAFDATGLVRGIDPNAVIGASRPVTETLLDSASARKLAEQVGAGRYVVGSVVRTGSELSLRATLYRADGMETARALVVTRGADGMLDGVESLVRQLAAAELRAPGDTMAALATSMTPSSRALRAYLDGERELRDARPAAAVVQFSNAVAADSLFALAWYRLARAARWSEVDSLNAIATQRAYALLATLPLRLQQVVRGYHALRFGNPAEAERQFRQIVADYPTDVDAWMLLGETLFENNPYVGRSTSEATPAFQRVMQLDPRNREVTVYLMELAARADQHGKLDTLFSMYFSPNSAGEQPGIRETYLALHARRVRQADHAISDPASAHMALLRAGSAPSDLRAARSYATVLTASTTVTAMRVDGLLALASLDLAQGRSESAGRVWRQAALLDPAATLWHRAMSMTAPRVIVPDDTVRAVLRLLDGAPVGDTTIISRSEQRALQIYLRGLLSLRLGDTASLERGERELARMRPVNRIAEPLRQALRGHRARARGDFPGALAAFEQCDVALPPSVRSRVPALAQYADRLARSEVLQGLNRTAEADRWASSLRDGSAVWGAPFFATTPEARARP